MFAPSLVIYAPLQLAELHPLPPTIEPQHSVLARIRSGAFAVRGVRGARPRAYRRSETVYQVGTAVLRGGWFGTGVMKMNMLAITIVIAQK